MFETLNDLGTDIDNVISVAQASSNKKLQTDVLNFVIGVGKEVDKAFSDVHKLLGEIAFLKPSELTEDKVIDLQKNLTDTYSRDKFKKVKKICDALKKLANRFHADIEPHLTAAGGVPNSSQLFWMLESHEGSFIHIIHHEIDEIVRLLDDYKTVHNIDAARTRARQAQKDLAEAMNHVMTASNKMIGALPNGSSLLLNKSVADEVLRKSPWFSGAFYLVVAVVLLTALTIVAGNVNPLMFPLVVGGAFAGLTLVGAFQLKNDDRLSEISFMKLVDLALRRVILPLSQRGTQ